MKQNYIIAALAAFFMSTAYGKSPAPFVPPGGFVSGEMTVQNGAGESIIKMTNGAPDELAGLDLSFIGGFKDSAGNKLSRGLYVSSQPYGAFGAGCGLCLIMTADGITEAGGRPAISGVDYRNGAASVVNSINFDQVGFYEFADNTTARMVLDVSAYTADGVTLKTPMTTAQMAQLHPNMYIQTNSIDSSLPETGTAQGLLPTLRSYFGFIKSWDATHIYVTGWAVPGIGSTAAGQVPSTSYDSWYSDYKRPVVFVGAPNKTFGRNLFLAYDGAKAGSLAISTIHQLEGEELDMFIKHEVRPHSVSLHGLTITPLFENHNPEVLTTDSYDLQLAGDIADHLVINEAAKNNVIRANSFYVHGNEGVGLAQNGAIQKRIGLEYSAWSDSGHNFRLASYLSKDGTTTAWQDTSLHLGLLIDGVQGQFTGSSPEGDIVWNGQGNTGGLALCGGSGQCGVIQHYDGSVTLGSAIVNGSFSFMPDSGDSQGHPYIQAESANTVKFATSSGAGVLVKTAQLDTTGDINVGNNLVLSPTPYNNLGSANRPGTQRYCSDCYSTLNADHTPGIPVWANGTLWTDALGNEAGHP
ncbi:hypothetical protein [Entomobacter blattae]|uniref:Uncharacterized protein n=1 Tax=Entomobacter blattae TaxID=2762277 RepID=A0A7H1NUJ8_9PROT|nr:hypothetical protein [Entomobacter blattae]QNT79175.1 hypothetical protein JGUZn3_19700 [Entomobacter blattae]QNT79458.1 hypothetical protein JGUZn3_22570 [Entomobacter blattae]